VFYVKGLYEARNGRAGSCEAQAATPSFF
jgi:hypothetical protein